MTNKYELYIHFLCLIHTIIWIIVLFGCFVSRELSILNIYIFTVILYCTIYFFTFYNKRKNTVYSIFL